LRYAAFRYDDAILPHYAALLIAIFAFRR
jgi:hypothetical protein